MLTLFMLMQMPGPQGHHHLLACPLGIFCFAKALGLGTHFGAKAPGMVTGQIDTCILQNIFFEKMVVIAMRSVPGPFNGYLFFFFFFNFLLEICNFLHLLLVFYNVMIYTLLLRSVLTVGALMRAILSKSQ